MQMADNALLDLLRLTQTGRRTVLATIVRAIGPSYRKPGASAIIAEDGAVIGAISGGCLDADIAAAAAQSLCDGNARLLDYDTGGEEDLIWGTTSGCGGRILILVGPVPDEVVAGAAAQLLGGEPVVLSTVIADGPELGRRTWRPAIPDRDDSPYWYEGDRLYQRVDPAPTLLVCGAGDDAQPVVHLAAMAGFRVVVVDHRPAWATPERFPEAADVVVGEPADIAARGICPPGAVAVVLSHQFYRDIDYVETLLDVGAGYVGLLGARDRSQRIIDAVLEHRPDLSESLAISLRAPVGLDIGADGPRQIALSIVAELVAARAGRHGGPMSLRAGALLIRR